MPYSSISSAPSSWRRLSATAGGSTKVPLTLSQLNYVARVYDGLVSRGKSKTQAAATAVGKFRSEHTVSNGRWIKKHDDIEYGVTKKCDVSFDSPFDITKHYQEGEAEEDEKWYVEGIAVIDKLDYQDDVVSPEAMRTAIDDLKKNSTVLYNHNSDQEVGTIVKYEFLGDSIFIKVLISKTRPDIWMKIKEGVLRKFSVRGRILAFDIRYVPEIDKAIRFIKAMAINEVSIVTVSAQADAEAFRWYAKEQKQPMSHYIEKAFESQRGGDSTMARKARKNKQAVPGFTMSKDDKGRQVITLLVPDEIQKSDDAPVVNLDDVEKVAKAAQAKLSEIITAAEEALKSDDEALKKWAGKVLEAAKALQDTALTTVAEGDEDTRKGDGDEDTDDSKGKTIQIVLPDVSKDTKDDKDDKDDTSKDDSDDSSDSSLTITAEDLAKADFQKCVITKMETGKLDMTKAAEACKSEMAKAEEAVGNDNGIVKMLLERLMNRDDAGTVLQKAVVEIAETVGKQTEAINGLTTKVQSIPLRKGLLTEDQIKTEHEKLQKKLEGKEPLEQLRVLFGETIGDSDTT